MSIANTKSSKNVERHTLRHRHNVGSFSGHLPKKVQRMSRETSARATAVPAACLLLTPRRTPSLTLACASSFAFCSYYEIWSNPAAVVRQAPKILICSAQIYAQLLQKPSATRQLKIAVHWPSAWSAIRLLRNSFLQCALTLKNSYSQNVRVSRDSYRVINFRPTCVSN